MEICIDISPLLLTGTIMKRLSIKETFNILIQTQEGKKALVIIAIGIALTFVAVIFHDTASRIPFIISIIGMIMCMIGTDQFARIVYLIHEQYDEKE